MAGRDGFGFQPMREPERCPVVTDDTQRTPPACAWRPQLRVASTEGVESSRPTASQASR
jgi:hypothetical protein